MDALTEPAMNEFLAIEHEAGMDGENWTVQDLAGKTIWKGYAGTKQGELTAHFVCASSKPGGVITLTRAPSGTWSWRGHGKCR